MNGKTAALLFVATCLILATLLLTKTITPLLSGTVFAVALALLGLISRGFKKTDSPQ